MTPFPRGDFRPLKPYDPGQTPIALDLSENTNLWGAHPAALEVVRKAPPEALSRYPSVNASDLKEAVADKYGVGPECVTSGCGSQDLLDSLFRASTVPPGRISFPSPSSPMVSAISRLNALETLPIPWRKASVDPARLLLEEPDLVYVCRPNNPTGLSLERDWVHGLLALGGPDGPLVVLDESYADFGTDSFLGEAPTTDRLMVVRSLSNLYGMAGLRVGFAVGPEDLVREVEKSRGPYKVSQVAEKAAVAALEDGSGWVDRIRAETLETRERLAQELTSRGLHPLPSQANFLLVPVEPASALEVYRALEARGVRVRPFPDLSEVGDAVRISIGPWALMERFLEALDSLFDPEGADSV